MRPGMSTHGVPPAVPSTSLLKMTINTGAKTRQAKTLHGLLFQSPAMFSNRGSVQVMDASQCEQKYLVSICAETSCSFSIGVK